MTTRQYCEYEHGGMARGFAPFLPYTAKNGVHFTPTCCHSCGKSEVLFFSTGRGVIHANCGVNWDQPDDSPTRLTMGAKYSPPGSNRDGHCEFAEYGTAALETIAGMVAEVHKQWAKSILDELEKNL
jgi:hypothetical protein